MPIDKLYPVLAIAFIIILLYLIRFNIMHLIKNRHLTDIRIVWYFFSLSLTFTSIMFIWGINTGAINNNGSFNDGIGKVIFKIIHLMIDIQTDFFLILSLIALLILPQIFNYILCGLFGCAGSIFLLTHSINFFFWFVIKSFSVIAGVALSLSVFGYYYSWEGLDSINNLLFLILASVTFLFASFGLLSIFCTHSDKQTSKIKLFSNKPIKQINEWLKRNN